jgi:hypothetical protein
LRDDARNNNMSLHIAENVSTKLDRCALATIGNIMPPRDPDEDEEDGDEEDEEENGADEPPVVREPDEG